MPVIKISNHFTLFCFVFVIIIGALGCSSTSKIPTSGNETTALRSWADPATQTTLEGLSEDNLAKYTQFADTQFKTAVAQDMLDRISSQIDSQLGSFKSITFLSTETQDVYIIVHYQAEYSKGQAKVRMVFDQNHQVAGQFFE
jgi:hypothetical protein